MQHHHILLCLKAHASLLSKGKGLPPPPTPTAPSPRTRLVIIDERVSDEVDERPSYPCFRSSCHFTHFPHRFFDLFYINHCFARNQLRPINLHSVPYREIHVTGPVPLKANGIKMSYKMLSKLEMSIHQA